MLLWKRIVEQSVLFPIRLREKKSLRLDLNRSDYRAWYGLGQVYEMLEMHYYALYYYEHALVYKSFPPVSPNLSGQKVDRRQV